MTNLINHFKNLISHEVFLKLSIIFNEREVKQKQAVEICICTLLVGLKNCKDVALLVKDIDEKELSYEHQLDSFFIKEQLFCEAHPLLNLLFPNKRERISEMISNEICIKSDSSRAIFNIVTLLILRNLKKEIPKNFSFLLDTQSQLLYDYLPRGVKLVLGLPNAEHAYNFVEETSSGFALSFFSFKKHHK